MNRSRSWQGRWPCQPSDGLGVHRRHGTRVSRVVANGSRSDGACDGRARAGGLIRRNRDAVLRSGRVARQGAEASSVQPRRLPGRDLSPLLLGHRYHQDTRRRHRRYRHMLRAQPRRQSETRMRIAKTRTRRRSVVAVAALLGLDAATTPENQVPDPVLTCEYWGCGNEVPLHCVSWKQHGITWTCWEAYKEGGPAPF